MNTKITNELLEDYAMIYPRIECVKTTFANSLFTPKSFFNNFNFEDLKYIQLRSIESINEEEVEKVAQIFNLEGWDSEFIASIVKGYLINGFKHNRLEIENANNVIQVLQYLHSIGIATPFRGITVDQLIESGKLKYKL